MKNFLKFFTEAQASVASERAKKMGLKGDGHGGWYNAAGEFVAKTEGGELKFYNKGQKPGKDQPEDSKKKAQAATTPQKTAAPTAPESGEGEEKQNDALTVVFGRFNPPTTGHKKLLDTAYGISSGSDFKVYPSRSQDAKKNPLNPDSKVEYMKKMFPKYEDNIINDDNMKTIFNVLQGAYDDGYTEVTIVVGADRLGEFQGLSHKYNGELYNYDELEVVSAGDRDPDAEGAEGMSASKLRLAAAEGDFPKFAKGVPDTLGNMDKIELFNVLRRSMNVSEETEIWEVAPKLDEEGVRDAYLVDGVYGVGDVVENVNTGLVGEVIRRGTNYVIAVTEDNIMFKSWLRDLVENPHEIGTDEYREYVQKLTPGQEVKSYTGVRIASIYDKFRKGKKDK